MTPIPGPSKLEALSFVPAMFQDRLTLLQFLKSRWGNIVRLNGGVCQRFVLYHPEMIKHVLVSKASNYCKGKTFAATADFLGGGISVAEGSSWSEQRHAINPYFKKQILSDMNDTFQDELERQQFRWQRLSAQARSVNLTECFKMAALSFSLRCQFGVTLSESEKYELLKLMSFVLDHSTARSLLPCAQLDIFHGIGYKAATARLRRLATSLKEQCAASNGTLASFFTSSTHTSRCPFASMFGHGSVVSAQQLEIDNFINLL